MLSIAPNSKVYLSLSSVDFRKQINGLKKWVQSEFELNPFSSAYFFFISRNKKSIKVLHFDGQGLCLYHKRLSEGKFKWWDAIHNLSQPYMKIPSISSQVILMNGSIQKLQLQENWKEIE